MLSALLLAWQSEPPGRRTYAIAGGAVGFIYGLLDAGGAGVLPALVALAGGTALGFVAGLLTGLPLRLPFSLAGAAAGLALGGVAQPLVVLAFLAAGAVFGWSTPWLFRGFNRVYGQAEGAYHRSLEWVLGRRRLIMGALLAGIALTAVAFNAIPSGFVPVEDQGYAIGIVQAPEGTSLESVQRLNQRVAAVLREEPSIQAAAVFGGAGLAGNAPNRGLFFFGTSNWSERSSADQAMGAIVARLNRKLAAIEEARILVIEPPAIPGYGTSGGFEFQLLNRSGGALSEAEFFEAAQRLVASGNSSGLFDRVFTQFSPEAPQLQILVDRDRMAALGVDFQSAMQAFSFNIGSFYVNDTFEAGRVRRVFVQADDAFRATPDKLRSLYTRNAAGEPVSLAEFIRIEPITGPSVIPRFNLFRAIQVEGTPAAGRSSGQAINDIRRLFEELSVQGVGVDWT
ncbi:MAG: efflux RND transporter permease subunit, partial [Cyanobium sp.]